VTKVRLAKPRNRAVEKSYLHVVYTTASFDPLAGAATKPHWHQLTGQLDYRLSKRTEVFFEGTYQQVSGGYGNPVFDAGIFNLAPATGNSQAVITSVFSTGSSRAAAN
jgi:predicted porin